MLALSSSPRRMLTLSVPRTLFARSPRRPRSMRSAVMRRRLRYTYRPTINASAAMPAPMAMRSGEICMVLTGVEEETGRQFDAGELEAVGEARADTRRLELSRHLAFRRDAGALEPVDLLQLDHVAFRSGHLGHAHHTARTIRKAAHLHDH